MLKSFGNIKKSCIFASSKQTDMADTMKLKNNKDMTKTFKTAKQASKELMTIARAFEITMDTTHTVNDMSYYANQIIKTSDFMKKYGKFPYDDVVYVRTRGVESSMEKVNAMHDTLITTILFGYDMNEKVWFVRK